MFFIDKSTKQVAVIRLNKVEDDRKIDPRTTRNNEKMVAVMFHFFALVATRSSLYNTTHGIHSSLPPRHPEPARRCSLYAACCKKALEAIVMHGLLTANCAISFSCIPSGVSWLMLFSALKASCRVYSLLFCCCRRLAAVAAFRGVAAGEVS